MQIDFVFRTYRSFGSDANGALATQWVESRLANSYGGRIESVIFECCCSNSGRPRKTLGNLHDRFEEWLTELPFWEIVERGKEIRVCYSSPRYDAGDADEKLMLSPDRFYVGIKKAAEVLSRLADEVTAATELRCQDLARDLSKSADEGPRSLDELAKLYLARSR